VTNVIGYVRVSRREQNPDAQEAELRAAGGSLRVRSGSRASTTSVRVTPCWCAASTVSAAVNGSSSTR
jgi:hypothetical protein